MKAVVAAFNQEKALVVAFSVITNLRMELFVALLLTGGCGQVSPQLSLSVDTQAFLLQQFQEGNFL